MTCSHCGSDAGFGMHGGCYNCRQVTYTANGKIAPITKEAFAYGMCNVYQYRIRKAASFTS